MLAEPDELSDELLEVQRRRYKEAKQAGLSIVEAKMFADNGQDVGILRALVKGDCPVELIVEIVT